MLIRDAGGQARELCPKAWVGYPFYNEKKWEGERLPSSSRHRCRRKAYSTRSSFVFGRKVSDSRMVVMFFFHLMAWGTFCGFVYSFMVKQACFIEQCSSRFLKRSLTYSGLLKFPRFPSLSIVSYQDFYNYLYNYAILSPSVLRKKGDKWFGLCF